MSKPQAWRKMIQRVRNRRAGYGLQVKHLKLVVIPENLRYTYKNHKFYWDDSGQDDADRIIIFTTQ